MSDHGHRDWHTLDCATVEQLTRSSTVHGIASEDAASRQATLGRNELPSGTIESWWKRLGRQFIAPLVLLLLASGVLALLLGELVDASVVFGIVFINALIGFVQEGRAQSAMRALQRSVHGTATVIRAGVQQTLDRRDIVVGDLVVLHEGDTVPADLRLVWTRECSVAEAVLTGESVAVAKHTDAIDADRIVAERTNMAYASTTVVRGSARGLAIAIGADTEVGRVSQHLAEPVDIETPITRRIQRFSVLLLRVTLVVAAVTIGIALLRGYTFTDAVMAAVALSVGAIPEGLPAAVTIILAIGVHRMAQRKAIIRRLPAVETLGSTTVICADKTGTLTENQMTVVAVATPTHAYTVEGRGYAPHGTIDVAQDAAYRGTVACGVLCSTASIAEDQGQWKVVGDPTEAALVVLGAKAGMQRDELHRTLPQLDVIPFSSDRQYMAMSFANGTASLVYMKGSVERVLVHCTDQLRDDGTTEPLDVDAIHAREHAYAEQGYRVLACAQVRHEPLRSALHESDLQSMTFLGLVAMTDPPRADVQHSIAICHRAGVAVKMITGDHRATAEAIARSLGIGGAELVSYTGRELEAMSDDALRQAATRGSVFARVSPEQKYRLVLALQREGHVVAMTGDGVNDAPALQAADIGVAMGRSGTDVAKDASAMVLTDDNFATIVAAIEEGRTVYDNIRSYVTFAISTDVGEGLVVLTAVALGIALPILPVQILWINLTTGVILGLPLAVEPPAPHIMRRSPAESHEELLGGFLIWRTISVGAFLLASAFGLYMYEMSQGSTIEHARTVAATAFVVMQMFYMVACRSHTRPGHHGLIEQRVLWASVVGMLALQAVFVYAPFAQQFFGTAAIDLRSWLVVVLLGVVLYAGVELEKYVRVRRVQRAHR